jgi:uncharacterized protein YggE
MKKIFLAIVLIGAMIQAFSQAAGNYLYNNNYSFNNEKATIPINNANGSTVTLKAEVMMNVISTSYTAIFAASQQGKSVKEVDSLMTLRIDQVRYALEMFGIAEEDIHIDAVSMVPTYARKLEEKKFSKRSTEIPTGFEMKKNIHILFKKHALLDPIISEMALADIYDLVKVEYNIDGVQTYYDELRKNALSVIDSKKATYDALKMHLTVYSLGDGFNSSYPMERYKSYTAFNSGSTYEAVSYAKEAKTKNITLNGFNNTLVLKEDQRGDAFDQQFIVQTSEKNKTIFYDRMPYNQFDKVLNADTEEPCIQLFYTLSVNYTMVTDEQYQAQQKQIKMQEDQLNAQTLLMNSGRKHRRDRN